VGTELTADALVGDLVLDVEWAELFTDDGGVLELNGVWIDYLTSDEDADTITLAAPLAQAAATGDPVYVVDGGQVLHDYLLEVDLGEGDTALVPIPYEQRDLWPIGDYTDPVRVELTDDLVNLEAVPQRTPLRDGSFLDPDTIPLPEPPPTSDGLAPTSSPTPTVRGAIGGLAVTIPAAGNPDPTTVDLYVSATSPVSTSGTPTATVSGEGPALVFVRAVGGSPVVTGTTYYAVTIARDEDGSGPVSAQGSAAPVQINSPDIAANAITADMLVVNDALIDALQVVDLTGTTLTGATVRTAASGKRIVLNPDNTITIHSGAAAEVGPGKIDGTTDAFGLYLNITAPSNRAASAPYPNQIQFVETATDASADRATRTIALNTARMILQGAYGSATFDYTEGTPEVELGGAQLGGLSTFWVGNLTFPTFVVNSNTGEVQAKRFAVLDNDGDPILSIDPNGIIYGATMNDGSVGTSTFRDDVRSNAITAIQGSTVGTGSLRDSVRSNALAALPSLGFMARGVSGTQNIASGSNVQVNWGSGVTTGRGGVSYSAGVFSVTDPGTYLVTVYVSLAANATGRRALTLRHGATDVAVVNMSAPSGGPTHINATAMVDAVAGDTFSAHMLQDSGGSLNVSAGRMAVRNLG
jgi:hypothetical protein